MTQQDTATGLYLPTALVDELVEKRALEMVRSFHPEGLPVSFFTTQTGLPIGIGQGIAAEALLREQKGWAAIANRAKANRVASIPWFGARVTQNEVGEPELEKLDLLHPLSMLLLRPNPIFSGRMARYYNGAQLGQTGAAYWQKLRDGIGVTRELWPLPTDRVEPIAMNGMVIGGYRVTSAHGRQVPLPLEDVVRIWTIDIQTVYGQLGDLAPQQVEYDAQRFEAEHMRAFFEKDATPRVALSATLEAAAPNKTQREAFHAAWRNSQDRRRGELAGLPAFLPPGFDVHEFNSESGTKDFVEWDSQWSQQIMAAWGVPKIAVGIDTNTNRATAETSMWAFDRQSILPLTDTISDQMTHQLAVEFGLDVVVAFEDFVAADKEFELKVEEQDLKLGVRTINEVRATRPEIETEVEWGGLPIQPFNNVPYDGEFREPPVVEPSPRGSPPLRQVVPAPLLGTVSHFDPVRVWGRNISTEETFVDPWMTAQRTIFRDQLDQTLLNLAKATGTDVAKLRALTFGGTLKTKALRALTQRTPNISVSQLFDPNAWDELMTELTGPIRETILAGSARVTAEALVEGFEFNLTTVMREKIATQNAAYISNINATTAGRITTILDTAIAEGSSVGTIAKNLSSMFKDRARTHSIARTEVGAANQSGVIEGFRTSGVVEKKQWNTSLDATVRPSHQIDGQTVGLDELFTLRSGAQGEQPLSRSLPVEDVVNCRCFVTPVIE